MFRCPCARAAAANNTKAVVFAPMIFKNHSIGSLRIARTAVGFRKEVDSSKSFADKRGCDQNVRLFDEIQDKSRQLAEASQHKSQFLANMSHELRTPLNAIIGVTEMLREDAEALKQDTEPLDRVLGAGRHLLALINDILDLSKIEAGRMELHLETFALAPLIDERRQDDRAAGGEERQPGRGPLRRRDRDDACRPERLRQALFNLMSNANKFTERGTITIDARHGAGERPRLGHARGR